LIAPVSVSSKFIGWYDTWLETLLDCILHSGYTCFIALIFISLFDPNPIFYIFCWSLNIIIKKIGLGSKSEMKINAIKQVYPECKIQSSKVSNQVSYQPMNFEETETGAINRAQAINEK
jgi:hypothetical protein